MPESRLQRTRAAYLTSVTCNLTRSVGYPEDRSVCPKCWGKAEMTPGLMWHCPLCRLNWLQSDHATSQPVCVPTEREVRIIGLDLAPDLGEPTSDTPWAV